MTYDEAVLRLANHANLAGERLPESESLAFVLWDATRRRETPEIRPLVADVMACLEVVNRGRNGPVPSKSVGRADDSGDYRVAYPVACIVADLLHTQRRWAAERIFDRAEREGLIEAAFRIAWAWSQVLAGDIDDLAEDVERA